MQSFNKSLIIPCKEEGENFLTILKRFEENIKDHLDIRKETLPIKNTRNIGKSSMILNTSTPHIEVDPETYEVRADGELLTCEPAEVLPLAQKYFMF